MGQTQSQVKSTDPIGNFFQGLATSKPNDEPKELPILPITGTNTGTSPLSSLFPSLTPPKTNLPIIDNVTKTVTNPIQVLTSASSVPSDIVNNLSNASSSLGLDKLTSQITSNTSSIGNIGSQITSATGSINSLGSQLTSTTGNLTNLLNQSTQATIGGLSSLSGQITSATGTLTTSVGNLSSNVSSLGNQLTNATGAITNLGTSQAQGFQNISGLLSQSQSGLFGGLNQLQTNIGSSISGLNQNIGTALQTTGNITAQGFDTVNSGISAISQGQLETIKALSNATSQTQSNIAGLTNTVNSNFQYIVILGALGAGVFVLSQNSRNGNN